MPTPAAVADQGQLRAGAVGIYEVKFTAPALARCPAVQPARCGPT